MRRLFAFGVALATAAGASAQFASDRRPAPPTGPAPITAAPPAAPSAPAVAPPSFSQVAATTPAKPSEPAPNLHPWYVKPEHGQWMILVKSYTNDPNHPDLDQAKPLAEALAKEIRDTYKTPAYLFEKGGDEKRKEEERVRVEREKKRAEQEKEFLALNDRLRAESFAKGYDFQETKPKYRVPKINYQTQYAVLIGGWKDMETARKALDVIRTWGEPQNKMLMDRGFVGGEAKKGEQTTLSGGYLNPFKLAFVVPNPAAPKTLAAEAGTDLLVLQMNKEEELSVLKIQKPWTLVVKAYYAPVVDMKDKDAGSVMSIKKLFNSRPDHLNKTADLAQNLAKTIRDIKPSPFESYVLHTLNGSLVCVGQFDSADDPRIATERARLEALRLNVGGKGVQGNQIYPFDHLALMRVK